MQTLSGLKTFLLVIGLCVLQKVCRLSVLNLIYSPQLDELMQWCLGVLAQTTFSFLLSVV